MIALANCLDGNAIVSDPARTARNVLANLATLACQSAQPIYHGTVMNLFGAAGYGIYAPALMMLEIPTRAGVCAMDYGLMRQIPIHRARGEASLEASAVGSALRVTFLAGLFLAVLIRGVTWGLAAALKSSMATSILDVLGILGFSLPFVLETVALASLALATQTARGNFWIRGVLEPACSLAGLLIAAVFWRDVEGLAWMQVAAAAATCTGATLVTAGLYGRRRLIDAVLHAPHHRAMERFALPLTVSELLSALWQYLQALVLPIWVGNPETLGVYFGAEYFARLVNTVRYPFDTIVAPLISEAHAVGDRGQVQSALTQLSRWVLILVLPVVLLFCCFPHAVLAIAGRDFAGGSVFLVAFAAAMGLNASFGLSGWVVSMTGRSRVTLMNNAIAVAVNLSLSLLLIPRFGAVGALASTITTMLSVRVLENAEAWGLERVHLFQPAFLKPFLAAGASFAVQWVVGEWLEDSLLQMAVATAVGLAVYLAALAVLGLTTEERRLLGRSRGASRTAR